MANLDPAQWKRARALFENGLDLTPAERVALLARESDDGIKTTVTGMWTADDAQGVDDPMEQMAEAAQALTAAPDDIEDLTGVIVGPYRLGAPIGRGGMSSVYLAERRDGQFQQKLAAKVPRRGMDAADLLRRFHNERRILGELKHPNIASIVSAGELPDGRPCILMEYVAGEPIDTYCRRKRLSIEERVRLVITVCQAVAHAHQRLVLHRDLKPGNILVDDQGHIKLLDFGISKVLGDLEGVEEQRTRTGFQLMTPEYAAPEQLAGEPAGTAVDVYALGRILYNLLTGALPSGDTTLGRARFPSAYFSGMDDTKRLALQEMGVQPRVARRKLRGDLDTIVAAAMHPDPQRRPSGAAALAEDLDNYLNGRPIAVRRDSSAYVVGKLLTRYPFASGFAALAVLSLTVGLTLALIQSQRAIQARDLARAEQARAEQVTALLTDVFRTSNPRRGKDQEKTAREILDTGSQEILEQKTLEPATRAELTVTMAEVYRNIGQLERAAELMQNALDEATQIWGARDPRTARILAKRARLHHWNDALPEAEDAYRTVVAIYQEDKQSNLEDLAVTMTGLGEVLLARSKKEDAERVVQEALALYARLENPDPRLYSSALHNWCIYLQNEKRYDEALLGYQDLLQQRKRQYGEEHNAVAVVLNNIASLHYAQGDYAKAAEGFAASVAVDRAYYGVDNTQVARGLLNLGTISYRARRYDDAVRQLGDAETAWENFAGRQNSSTLTAQARRASALFMGGQIEAAEQTYRDVYKAFTDLRGEKHRTSRLIALDYAYFLLLQNRPDEALPWAENAWQRFQQYETDKIEGLRASAVLGAAKALNGDPSGHAMLEAAGEGLQNLKQTSDPRLETAKKLRPLLAKQNQTSPNPK